MSMTVKELAAALAPHGLGVQLRTVQAVDPPEVLTPGFELVFRSAVHQPRVLVIARGTDMDTMALAAVQALPRAMSEGRTIVLAPAPPTGGGG
jgi:hypothetical protein